MSMSIGLGGVNAATRDLDTTANNIANVSTFGFKYSRAEFGDLVAGSAGIGVYTQNVNQLFGQGGITTTDNALDFAINGSGFFQVRDVDGAGATVAEPAFYTRNGSFHLDKDGYIVNNQGQRLQGVGGTSTAAADMKFGGTGPWTLVTMDKNGALTAKDSTGATVTATPALGLANFNNVNALKPVGDANWIATTQSGDPNGAANALVAPGTGTVGKVMNCALESSNVNLTGQLVNMIIAQRNFGANAKTITANSEMAQTIIAMR